MNNLNCLIPILIPSILWGIYPTFYTHSIKKLGYKNVYILAHTFNFLIISIYAFFNRNEIELFNYKNIKTYIILFIGTILLSIAYFYFYKSIKICNKSYKVVSITYTLPVILATICSTIFLREKINLTNIMGISLALFGIYLIYI